MKAKFYKHKVKHVDKVLHAADIHIARLHWVIGKSDHKDVLLDKPPQMPMLPPIHLDGGACSLSHSWRAYSKYFQTCITW